MKLTLARCKIYTTDHEIPNEQFSVKHFYDILSFTRDSPFSRVFGKTTFFKSWG